MGARLSYPTVDLKEKVSIVTGGNRGIGYATARELAAMGSRVIIGCRSEERAKQAIEQMKQEVAAKDPGREIDVEYLPIDLSSLESTNKFAQSVIEKRVPVNILVLNAATYGLPFGRTEDGIEQIFQVNYLSHLLLTLLLLPVIKSSAPDARIITTTAYVYRDGVFRSEDVEGTASYSSHQSTCNASLFNLMMCYSLERRLADTGVSMFSVDPKWVDTVMGQNYYGPFMKRVLPVLRFIGLVTSVDKGSSTHINAAVNPAYAGQGSLLFYDCKPEQPKLVARNEEHQEQLLNYSLNLLRAYLDVGCMTELGFQMPKEQTDQSKREEQQPADAVNRTDKEEKQSAD